MGYCYKCDRCGKLIERTAYIVSMSAKPIENGLAFSNCESASFNICQSMTPERMYCRECLSAVKELLKPIERGNTDENVLASGPHSAHA